MEPADRNKKGKKNRPHASHGGDRWVAQARWGIPADQFLDFSASINPLGPPSTAIQAIRENLHRLEYYPEPAGLALKKALAETLPMDEGSIVLGNGSTELIYLCAQMFCRHRIMVLAPGFSEYGQGVENPCILRLALDLNDMRLPLAEIAENLAAGDLLFVNNPNNPTANLFPREELLQLVALVNDRQARLVIDESFIDFVEDWSASLRDVSGQDGLIILGSLTKFFALPGLRIGYALSSQANIQKMENMLPPWRINTLALLAGEAAVRDQNYIKMTHQLINAERAFLADGLSQIKGLQVYPSQANFILIDARGRDVTAVDLQAKLGPEGILIRDCSDFYHLSPYHVRLAVRSRGENEILLKSLGKVFE